LDAQQFIDKWRASTLTERAATQSHFNDLCALLGQPTPTEADPAGTWYTFEKGATKTTGGKGWADVWKRGCFGWEYKGKGKDLDAAYQQLLRYAVALENPPLLVVSDMDTLVVRTNFTNTIQETHVVRLEDLLHADSRRLLAWVFTEPERLRPGKTREAVTAEAARTLGELAQRLRQRGLEPHKVAHFVTQLLFCLFAEDIGMLPGELFSKVLRNVGVSTENFSQALGGLFSAMKTGGFFGADRIPWFDGNLFSDSEVLPLEGPDIDVLRTAADMDWSSIEPSIFGTLFERGLDPDKRSQLGAHYTDPGSILRLVRPVVEEPLKAEWREVRAKIDKLMDKALAAKDKSAATKAKRRAEKLYQAFLLELRQFTILDPACGSGNFLYLGLRTLKDLEHQAILEAEQLGLHRQNPDVGPEAVRGIEINPYAAELARVTVWIGEIQWMLNHGYSLNANPVLKPLDQIECRDAVLNPDGTEPEWPEADVIVGNPPFLGNKKMISVLGEEYVSQLRDLYEGRVPGGVDLVTYWFEKARAMLEAGKVERAGLVATNSIRGGWNRRVLERIRETGYIFDAWDDEPWIVEGAAVRVSLVSFAGKASVLPVRLDGEPVAEVYADLTARTAAAAPRLDLTRVGLLAENAGIAFQGPVKVGPFDVDGDLARQWLLVPNTHGKPNSAVLRPWANGMDVTRRPSDTWIVDFGVGMTKVEAALYQAPFEYVRQHVKPLRDRNRDVHRREQWWLLGRSGEDLRAAVAPLSRYAATARVAKHRLFVWLPGILLPDCQLVIIARDHDTTFGILHSRFHELWTLRMCTWLGKGNDPRYTSTTTFETFPFPEGLTPNIPAADYASDPRAVAIAETAKNLVDLRDAWLNPPEWVERVPEVVPGYPDRLVPKDAEAAEKLKKRTLTNLYNERPEWLRNAHRTLDEAVAAAYGWERDLSDNEILKRLLELNLERSARQVAVTRLDAVQVEE
jgi:type II restriction/modification system DNA methylase subunit YeeA